MNGKTEPGYGAGESLQSGADAQSIRIPAEQLPPGIKTGDSLKCTGMDEGGCTFDLVKGDGGNEESDWAKDFGDDVRKSMSPRAEGMEAM